MILDDFEGGINKKEIVVYTQGVFDLLHFGHINYLKNALDFGNKLIIGLDSDEKVQQRKGINRPIQNWHIRAQKLLDLQFVDYVFKKEIGEDSLEYIKKIMPNYILVPSEQQINISRKNFFKDNNIKVIKINRTNEISTTKIINSQYA